MAGFFVTFEGIDGAGKSTQIKRLGTRLEELGHELIITQEPGGTQGADEIRKLLVEGEAHRWSAETELLLFMAARRDHVERIILPALAGGKIVLCDRFVDSTRIYQGAKRGGHERLRPYIDQLHTLMIGFEADVTFIFDIAPREAQKRITARAANKAHTDERFEGFGIDFQQRLRRGFLELAAQNTERCHVIDATQPKERLTEEIFATIRARLDCAPTR